MSILDGTPSGLIRWFSHHVTSSVISEIVIVVDVIVIVVAAAGVASLRINLRWLLLVNLRGLLVRGVLRLLDDQRLSCVCLN